MDDRVVEGYTLQTSEVCLASIKVGVRLTDMQIVRVCLVNLDNKRSASRIVGDDIREMKTRENTTPRQK